MPSALAIAAHPDDIEFVMAGTLLLLKEAGWEIHCFNVANGCFGSLERTPAAIARIRRREAQAAARVMGAVWHPPVCPDLGIFYDDRTLRRVGAVIRAAAPSVILTHSPRDYMEDHTNAARLAVTAAFARELPGFRTVPPRAAVRGPVTIYHACPHSMRDQLRQRIRPGAYVDTTGVHATKREALACHASQGGFLDATQGMDSYLKTMDSLSREVGRLSGRFRHAEGWRRHLHYGFGDEGDDPLRDVLGGKYLVDRTYERGLTRFL